MDKWLYWLSNIGLVLIVASTTILLGLVIELALFSTNLVVSSIYVTLLTITGLVIYPGLFAVTVKIKLPNHNTLLNQVHKVIVALIVYGILTLAGNLFISFADPRLLDEDLVRYATNVGTGAIVVYFALQIPDTRLKFLFVLYTLSLLIHPFLTNLLQDIVISTVGTGDLGRAAVTTLFATITAEIAIATTILVMILYQIEKKTHDHPAIPDISQHSR